MTQRKLEQFRVTRHQISIRINRMSKSLEKEAGYKSPRKEAGAGHKYFVVEAWNVTKKSKLYVSIDV